MTSQAPDNTPHPLLRYFEYSHLRPDLAEISRSFHDLALIIDRTLPAGSEKTVALRKVLEGKDAAVRAGLPSMPTLD